MSTRPRGQLTRVTGGGKSWTKRAAVAHNAAAMGSNQTNPESAAAVWIVSESPGANDLSATEEKARITRKRLAPLHWGVRLVVLFIGGLLIVVGIAGLVLPGIQGILTIVLGLAVVSLASDFVHRQLRKLLVRWPKAHQMMERFRERVHGWLSR